MHVPNLTKSKTFFAFQQPHPVLLTQHHHSVFLKVKFERKVGPNPGTICSLQKYRICLRRGERKACKQAVRIAQSQLLKAARKEDLTGSAEVFLPQSLPVADGVYNAYHMLSAIIYKQSHDAKTAVCADLPRPQGLSNTSKQKLLCYPTKPR